MARSISVSPASRVSISMASLDSPLILSRATMSLTSDRATGQPLPLGIVVEWQQMVAFGQLARHQRQSRRIDDRVGEVYALLAQALGKRVAQRGLRHEAERNEQLADGLVGLHLLEQGDSQLVFAENALGDQNLTKLPRLRRGSLHRWILSKRERGHGQPARITVAVQGDGFGPGFRRRTHCALRRRSTPSGSIVPRACLGAGDRG